uniref:hypothetical protein n=1 Tax=Anaerovibrio sp. TaxID=1872532 RepID=UPI0025F7020E
MDTVIITADIVCIGFMLITLFGTIVNSKVHKESTRCFILNLVVIIIGTGVDAYKCYLTVVPHTHFTWLLVSMLSYSFGGVWLIVYSMYLVSVIRTKVKISYMTIKPAVIIGLADIILVFIGGITGNLIYIENDVYVIGHWRLIPGLMPLLCVLYLFGILAKYISKMEL